MNEMRYLLSQWEQAQPECGCAQLFDQTLDFIRRRLDNPVMASVFEKIFDDDAPFSGPILSHPSQKCLTSDQLKLVLIILNAVSKVIDEKGV